MRLYRIHYTRDGGESDGYSYCSTKREAELLRKDEPDNVTYESIVVKVTKDGILSALNQFGSHCDNG